MPSIIKNWVQLEGSDLRRRALDIIEAGIARVLPTSVMQAALSYDVAARRLSVGGDAYRLEGRLFVVGGGKASGLMAQELERVVGVENISDGVVAEKSDPADFATGKIRVMQAGHPVPDARGVAAVEAMLRLKQRYEIGKKDLVLCLISGGGSALMPYPAAGISLDDKQDITRRLLASGAAIHEINVVRRHLSGVKGGRLAQYFAPAAVVSLIISDVVGNDLSVIASGPTYPDPSTYKDAWNVLETYGLTKSLPESVANVLGRGRCGEIAETPKWLDNARNHIIGDNRLALEAMAQQARSLGLRPLIITDAQTGDTATVAEQRAREIISGAYSGYDALLIGGETTPTLPPDPGRGGRNQHYAALTMQLLEEYPGDWVAASVGTDGSDFIPDVAGAIIDKGSLKAVREREPDFAAKIARFDSNAVLAAAGNSLVVTGDTHTNVGDIILYLLG